MVVKAVVFDLDGTLAEFNLDYKKVRAEVKQLLVKNGLPGSLFSIKQSIFEMLRKAQVCMRNNGLQEEYPVIRNQVLSIASKHEIEAAHKTSLLPGVLETLKVLKSMNLKLAIFTINGKKPTEVILGNYNLSRFFDAIITRELVPDVKPDPSHLEAVLRALEVPAHETIVFGDGLTDMKSAKALEATGVGLTSKKYTGKMLRSAGASYTIDSATQLPSLITELDKGKL